MKKGVSCFLILNLFLSIVAFSFILNSDFISAQEKKKDQDKTPSSSPVPISAAAASGLATFKNTPKIIEYSLAEGKTLDIGGQAITKAYKVDGVWKLKSGSNYYTVGNTDSVASLDNGLTDGTLVAAKEAVETTGSSTISEYLNLQTGTYTDAIVSGAQWAGIVGVGSYMIADFLGADEGQSKAIGVALGAGTFAGKSLNTLFSKGGEWSSWFGDKTLGMTSGQFSFVAGAATAAIIFLAMYKSESTETKTFTCEAWQAPTGGANCEKCNKQGILPCSEYQCKSLGQSCELLNQGTDEESCTWVNRKDVNPPVIKPLTNALLHGYVYAPDTTISPPDKGVKVQNTALASKCAEAFTPLTFGIITNEPAQCKISPLREKSFEDMTLFFGGSTTFTYNHTQVMILPGADALNASGITLDNDGNFEVFTRCQDANGNANTANFVFKYCVEKGPDTTPPLIVTTSLLNNMPIAYNQTSVAIDVFTNEPATCKWAHLDKSYDIMNQTMTCSSSVLEMNTQMLYKCSTTLTGLKNQVDNDFYFRCKDLANNMNTQSYPFTLIGTRPLVIDSVSPNNTVISDATDVIQVNLNVLTSAGYKDGESACYYSDTGTADSYVMFFNTNSHNHSQELWLAAGNYDYFIKCLDLGGNTDQKTINFVVESDVLSPLVVRVYHEGTYLKLVTNEKAECVYDTTSCSYTFEDGIKMSSSNKINHYTDWDTQTNFYIKCQDSYGNKPLPDKCNIIAKPASI